MFMKKKILLLVPVIALLASCAGSNNVKVPAGGTELDIYEEAEEGQKTAAQKAIEKAVDESSEGLKTIKGVKVSSTASGNASVGLNAKLIDSAKYAEDPNATVDAYVTVEGSFKEQEEAGFGGFSKEGFELNDLYGYVNAKGCEASLKASYNIPETYFALLQNYVPFLKKNAASANYSLASTSGNAYLSGSKAYVDATDPNIEKLYTQVTTSDFFDFGEKGAPTWDELLSELKLEKLKFAIDLADASSVFDFNKLEQLFTLPDSLAGSIGTGLGMIEEQKELFQALNLKVYSYGDNSVYALAATVGFNKASIEKFYNDNVKGDDKDAKSFDEFLAQYGITLNALDVNLGVTLYKNGGYEVAANVNIDIKLDAVKLAKSFISEAYASIIDALVKEASATLKVKGEVSASMLKADETEIKNALPASFEDYKLIEIPTKSAK